MPRHRADQAAPYRAAPALEQRLTREREVQLTGGPYRATIARAGRWYEAWRRAIEGERHAS